MIGPEGFRATTRGMPPAPRLDDLAHPDAQELLADSPLARLAFAGVDGLPRVVPIGFFWDGERIVMCTAPVTEKVRALSVNPNVALTIDTEVQPPKALLIRGLAHLETVPGVPDEFVKASTKTFVGAQARAFEAQARALYQEMTRISVEPTWVRFYDFGAGRVPPALRRLQDDS
jgi:Pyridoxamine 5'-phosphate oxidase